MGTLYLYQETDDGAHWIYTLYLLTSLEKAPTEVARDWGVSTWLDERTPIKDWAAQKVYEMIGDEIANDNVFIRELK